MIVAFQGELGAYSEMAVRAVYPDADLLPCETFAHAFEAIVDGTVDRGVLPIENSLFGSVYINYDHLRRHPVSIIGEVQIRIRHQLMAPEGAGLDGISRVYSHPQALGQCRESLRALVPQAETVPVTDTAGAARQVAEAQRENEAAIASHRAAERYGLQIIGRDIEDHPQNYTRFLVLAATEDATASDFTPDMLRSSDAKTEFKTSIVFAHRENVPGALFKSLAVFALRDLDLYKIESRPLVGAPGRYLFYLDVHGRESDDAVARALENLREITTELQVLGSYPVG
jgi:prephenate dehydratase